MSAPISYSIDQPSLMPVDLREWLPADDIAYYVSNTIDRLDLTAITCRCGTTERRGRRSYDPVLMTKLIIFGFVARVYSSRELEAATHKRVDFRVLAANQHPDHDTIAAFRQKHVEAIAGLFKQVLRVCIEMRLVAFESLSVDGTKILANASIRANRTKKSLLKERAKQQALLGQHAQDCLKKADAIDAEDNAKAAKCDAGIKSRSRSPRETVDRIDLIDRIIATMNEENASSARTAGQSIQTVSEEVSRPVQSTDIEAKPPTTPVALASTASDDAGANSQSAPPAQSEDVAAKPVTGSKARKAAAPKEPTVNMTDSDSRMMRDGATKAIVQSYNGQIAVDSKSQIIVAAAITQDANDKKQLVPITMLAIENTGTRPEKVLADSGYYSENQVTDKKLDGIEVLVPPDRNCTTCPTNDGPSVEEVVRYGNFIKYSAPATTIDTMRSTLTSAKGRADYGVRGRTVEPVFGQIKEAAGFRRFLTRGLESVGYEWTIVCMASNLKKMYRAAMRQRMDGSEPSAPKVREKVCHLSRLQVQMAM